MLQNAFASGNERWIIMSVWFVKIKWNLLITFHPFTYKANKFKNLYSWKPPLWNSERKGKAALQDPFTFSSLFSTTDIKVQ